MKIAFLHYHLKTGGVTTVLRQQAEVVQEIGDALVLTGEMPDRPFPVEAVHVPGLGYDGSVDGAFSAEAVAASVLRAIFLKWKDGCDVLHMHNPTLAKNSNFLNILDILKNNNIRLFLQIHDFAEDGRPLAYFRDEYPSDCHYGVINSRDYGILREAGLIPQGLHKIPNTITPVELKPETDIPYAPILYPIRGIRRKNIGEAILLSLLTASNDPLCITLPPNSPADIRSYDGWKNFVAKNRLNVLFDAGTKHDFSDLIRASRFLITTSITEGFGFSFLEPWVAEKLLWGRNLPDISGDFEKKGIRLEHLYTRLEIPVEWAGKERLYDRWRAAVLSGSANFNVPVAEATVATSFSKVAGGGTIDFGLLDEALQKSVLSRVLEDAACRDRLVGLNPYLNAPGRVPNPKALIQNNRNAVLTHYNKRVYKQRLLKIYTSVTRTPVRQRIDKQKLFSLFFTPENFSLLKWGEYVED